MLRKAWIHHVPTFFILFFVFVFILNSPLRILPAHDEIVSISTFLDIRSLFLKYIPNNHTITGLIGIIISNIFGVNILYLRLISFIFFILIIFVVSYKEKNNFIPILLLTIYFSYDTLADYSFLFRGYYFLSFGFVLIYYLLKDTKDTKNIRYIYLLSSLLLIHSLGSIYLILPIIFFLFLKSFREKKYHIIYYFLLPTLAFYIVSIPVTGAYVNKELVFKFLNEKNYFQILFNMPKIYFDGIKEIISPKLLENFPKLITNHNDFHKLINYNKILLFIFLVTFLKSSFYAFKRKRIMDYSIFSLFFIILILNKMPPERLLISYVFVLVLYLIEDLNFQKKEFSNFYLIIKILLLIFISYKGMNFKILSSNEINLVESKSNTNIEKNCILSLSSKNQFDYHYFYYVYLTKCNKKPNIIQFYNFYKTRLV